MKVLFVSARSSLNDQIEKAFNENGARVFRLNERMNVFLPSFINQNELVWRLLRKFSLLKKLNNNRWNDILIGLCKNIEPDILFTTKGVIIYPDTLVKIRAMGIKTVNWFFENIDPPNYKGWFLKTHQYYDYFFNYDPMIAEKFKLSSGNPKYLPVAVDPDFYKVQGLDQKERDFFSCDVCFVGALYPEREKLLAAVKKLGVNLKIFGWKSWFYSSLAESYHGPLSIKGIARAYSLAKISLNNNLQPQNGGVNLKTFEIPASRGFQISDDQPDLKNLFEPGKEIETYKTEDELLDKIKFYLSNEIKRHQVALAGYQRVLRDHSLNQRIKTILEAVKAG